MGLGTQKSAWEIQPWLHPAEKVSLGTQKGCGCFLERMGAVRVEEHRRPKRDAFAGRQRGYHRSPADLLYRRYRPQVINDTNAASCVCTHTNAHVQLLHLPRRLCCAEALHHPHFPPREELAQLQAPSSPRGKHTSQCHHGLCPRPRASRRSVNNTSSTPPCVCTDEQQHLR